MSLDADAEWPAIKNRKRFEVNNNQLRQETLTAKTATQNRCHKDTHTVKDAKKKRTEKKRKNRVKYTRDGIRFTESAIGYEGPKPVGTANLT